MTILRRSSYSPRKRLHYNVASVVFLAVRRFFFLDSLSLAGSELLELALDRLLDDPHRVRVALGQGLGHHLRLFEANVRWQRRHFGVGDRLVDYGPVSV